jgi:hypothetical protein
LDRLEVEDHVAWVEKLHVAAELHREGHLDEHCPLGGSVDV